MGYQWTFIVKEVINFSETTLTVYGDTIDEALEKIEFLRIAEFMQRLHKLHYSYKHTLKGIKQF